MEGRMYDSMNVMNECRLNDPIVLFIMKNAINNLNSIFTTDFLNSTVHTFHNISLNKTTTKT
jgi:hypothetical protein